MQTTKKTQSTSGRWLVIGLAALLILGVATYASAQRGGRGYGYGMMGGGMGGPGMMGGGSGGRAMMGGGMGGPGMMGPGMMGGGGFGGLNLTDEQRQALDDLRTSQLTAMTQTRQQLSDAQQALQELLLAETPDQAAIDAAVTEVSRLRTELMRAQINARLRILREILTPEQRTELRERRQEWLDEYATQEAVPGRRGGGPGFGMGHMGGGPGWMHGF
ncbi:MAG: Spy/CpxP family protein refolding chaperone [Candidatus Tectomicrobia bacterium]|nr:Spy/CpxP family protein refolding chaperone [Candidatus Tectomicrobia bacterium]